MIKFILQFLTAKKDLLIPLLAALAAIGGIYFSYQKGKEVAKLECLKANIKQEQKLEATIQKVTEKNKKLADKLLQTLRELDRAKTANTKDIYDYVKKHPDADEPCFGPDGLQLLNTLQKPNRATTNK